MTSAQPDQQTAKCVFRSFLSVALVHFSRETCGDSERLCLLASFTASFLNKPLQSAPSAREGIHGQRQAPLIQ